MKRQFIIILYLQSAIYSTDAFGQSTDAIVNTTEIMVQTDDSTVSVDNTVRDISNDVFTNKRRHELSLGFGTPSAMLALWNIGDGGSASYSPFNLHTQYMYNISKHFSVGACFSYSAYKYKYYAHIHDGNSCMQGEKIGESSYYPMFTFGVTVRAYWFYKKHFAMYSKYGITLSYKNEKSNRGVLFCPYNLSLVGLEFGGKKLRGYCEPLCLISMWPAIHAGVKYLF